MASSTSGPPYYPSVAQLGLEPDVIPDIPLSAIFLVLFLCSAATNSTILRRNLAVGHKFVFNGLMTGFSVIRSIAMILRMAWATHHGNTRLVIAALIFAAAGTVLLFMVNLFFAMRILRALHPRFGWHRVTGIVFRVLATCVICCLIMIVVCTIHTLYTLDTVAIAKDHKVQLFALTFLAFLAFLPVPMVLLSIAVPRTTPVEMFGTGRFSTKVKLVLFGASLLTVGAAWRAAVSYATRSRFDPGWWDAKAAYYCVNYVAELIVVFTYAYFRVDQRFWVPDGSCKAGDYSRAAPGGAAAAAAAESEEHGLDDVTLGQNTSDLGVNREKDLV